MALANVASLLTKKYGRRVLVIDWDLEAPGLHRFFDIPQHRVGAGLIDLLNDYKNLLRKEVKTLPSSLIEIKKYINTIPMGNGASNGVCSILPAGRQDDSYAKQVNEFNWEEFYATWHGFAFMEYLKEQLKTNADADLVLIDSRTGITDIGGICTMQLPDVVVLLFALNEQNIDGVEKIVKGIIAKSTESTERKEPPKLLLRPSRVERYLEQEKKRKWEEEAAARLGPYLSPRDRENPVRFMKRKSIPYVGAYGFGEVPLAADTDPDAELTEAFEDLACAILQEAGLWTREDARLRGVPEDEDDYTEGAVPLSKPSMWEGVVEAVRSGLRSISSPIGILSLMGGLLLYFGVMLWSSDVAASASKRFLFVAVWGGLGGCCGTALKMVLLRNGSESGVIRSLVSVIVSGIFATTSYSAAVDTGLITPTSKTLIAGVAFALGYFALQALENVTKSLLPRR